MTAQVRGANRARLLAPRSIAFIGGFEADVAVRETRKLGYSGKIFAVHPTRDNLGGIPTVPSVDDLPEAPEAAFICIKREPTIEVARKLHDMGSAGIVCYASGFSEVGDEGANLQTELIEAVGDMALIGPNCYGVVNYLDRLSPWPDTFGGTHRESGVAIVSQSGSMALNFTFAADRLPIGFVCALGNQAQTGMGEMLDLLAEDDRVTAIGLHIEGLTDVESFARAAGKARRLKKPVIALKTGRSEAGARTTRSHTNSLSGSDDLYNALFDRYGIARCKTMSSFTEALILLHFGGPPSGYDICSMSCSGGEAALAADLLEPMKLRTPPFPQHSKQALAKVLNEYVQLENPLDYHTFIWGEQEKLTECYAGVLGAGFDASVLLVDTPNVAGVDNGIWRSSIDALIEAQQRTGGRAIVSVHLPESMDSVFEKDLRTAGIPVLRGLQDTFDAVEAAAHISDNWLRKDDLPRLVIPENSGAKIMQLSEFEAKRRLADYGLSVPQSVHCAREELGLEAERLGFPLTLKVSSENLAHKTEAGGLALNLLSVPEVEQAAASMEHLGEDFLLERMVEDPVCEIIIGIKRDAQFGLALVIGAGGVLTELLEDSATVILPATQNELERALTGLKVFKLIDGYRGKQGDKQAVLHAIEVIASFAVHNADKIEELDVNPLLVLPQGKGAVAVDALLRIRENQRRGP